MPLYFSEFTMFEQPSLCFLLILEFSQEFPAYPYRPPAFDFQGYFQGSLSRSRMVHAGVQEVKQSQQKTYLTNILPVSANVVCEANSLYKGFSNFVTWFPFWNNLGNIYTCTFPVFLREWHPLTQTLWRMELLRRIVITSPGIVESVSYNWLCLTLYSFTPFFFSK